MKKRGRRATIERHDAMGMPIKIVHEVRVPTLTRMRKRTRTHALAEDVTRLEWGGRGFSPAAAAAPSQRR